MIVIYLLLLLFGSSNSIKCYHTTHGKIFHEVICPIGTAGCMLFEMSKVYILTTTYVSTKQLKVRIPNWPIHMADSAELARILRNRQEFRTV